MNIINGYIINEEVVSSKYFDRAKLKMFEVMMLSQNFSIGMASGKLVVGRPTVATFSVDLVVF